MFTCTACYRRALQNLACDLPPEASTLKVRGLLSVGTSRQQRKSDRHNNNGQRQQHARSHATLSSLKKGHHRRDLIHLKTGRITKNSPLGKNRVREPWKFSKSDLNDALARERNRTKLQKDGADDAENEADDEGGKDFVRPSEMPDYHKPKTMHRQNNLEARRKKNDMEQVEIYYKDPLQLANGVLQRLRVPDIEGALSLCRVSDAFHVANTVSWNHCMDWYMAQEDIKMALKIYNEFKKRGHKPDAHTYTIMLRGLSQNVFKTKDAVQEAIKIYNSIFAPNSNVTPSIIHTNAIINVCAKGGDLDQLWAVAGKMPERGPGSPDRVTFSTILNAIHQKTIKESLKTIDTSTFHGDLRAAKEARQQMFAQAVDDGRKLWEDVSHRWRRADLVIDERLVCAMGRLLLGCGGEKDIAQIFDLVETTMNLRIPERGNNQAKLSVSTEPLTEPMDPENDTSFELAGGEQSEKGVSNLPLKESNVYATPDKNTLSLLMTACLELTTAHRFAPSYWDLLTNKDGLYRVQPDIANIRAYLRVLRKLRASRQVYALLNQSWPDEVAEKLFDRGTFVLAFTTCLRDKNNPNVFGTAQKLFKLMEERLEEKELGMYGQTMKLGSMHGGQRKAALQERKKMLDEMNDEEFTEWSRRNSGQLFMSVDPKALQYFVELGIATTNGWNEGLRGKDDGKVFGRDTNKNHTIIALRTAEKHSRQLKRLMTLKLNEQRHGPSPPRKSPKGVDRKAQSGSQVLENIEELFQLMRVMVGGYDKVIEMAERFQRMRAAAEKNGQKSNIEQMDPDTIRQFTFTKREYTAFMGRIETNVARQMRDAQAIVDKQVVGEANDELESEENEKAEHDEEDEEEMPSIEQRIKTVVDNIDSKIRIQRAMAKGRRSDHYAADEPVPLHSRRQKLERTNMLNDGVRREFRDESGYVALGELDDSLKVVDGEYAKDTTSRIRSQRLQSLGAGGDLRGPWPGVSNVSRSDMQNKKAPPQIGDELDFDNDEYKSETTHRDNDHDFVPMERNSSSITRNLAVRAAWSGERRRAAFAARR